jgi:hypothetical protein
MIILQPPFSRDESSYHIGNLFGARWLHDMGVEARRARSPLVIVSAVPADRDKHCRWAARQGAHPACHLITVHVRQTDIEQHHVRIAF